MANGDGSLSSSEGQKEEMFVKFPQENIWNIQYFCKDTYINDKWMKIEEKNWENIRFLKNLYFFCTL